MLTQVIIERYSTQSFADFVSTRIFGPLAMSSTTYSISDSEAAGTAAHAFTKAGRRIPTWLTDAEIDLIAGAGGIVSSTHDLARWVTLLLGYGSEEAKKALPAEVLDEVMGPQALVRLPGLSIRNTYTYGFGWLQWTYHGHRVREYTASYMQCADGWTSGFTTFRERARGFDCDRDVPGPRTWHNRAVQRR
jgi:CubicO group peptidase (beta-lactamase class C family)